MIAHPTVDRRRMSEARNHAWHVLHAHNRAAHRAGAANTGHPERNPYKLGTDQRYWWNEGVHGRPFAPLTDDAALNAAAMDLITQGRASSFGRNRRPTGTAWWITVRHTRRPTPRQAPR